MPMSRTLYAAAPPNDSALSSARISTEIGRLRCVYRTTLATNSPTPVIRASVAPATSPGRAAGSTTRQSARGQLAPSPRAASSSDGSICRSEPSTALATSGTPRTK
jgi:hypothetical protein